MAESQLPLDDAAADRQHAERTTQAVTATREWFIERAPGDLECSNLLDAISADGGLIHDVHPMPDGSFVIVWWAWK